MNRVFMRCKLHGAVVSDANVEYVGSITLDPLLMKAAGLLPYEQVDVLNISNGNRLTTYVIEGKAGKGEVTLNGAAAKLCRKGDRVLVVAYAWLNDKEAKTFKPITVFLNKGNKVGRILRGSLKPSGFKV